MSTNSRIGILHENGTTETIYCHWDGYPEHQMPILTEHYDTAEKVQALLALVDISSLVERIAPDADEPHSFEKPAEGVTVAYHASDYIEAEREVCLETAKEYDVITIEVSGSKLLEVFENGRTQAIQESEFGQ